MRSSRSAGVKARVGADALLPARRFLGIERVVGHHHLAHTGQREHVRQVRFERLRVEVRRARASASGAPGSRPRAASTADDAACGLGDRACVRRTAPARSRRPCCDLVERPVLIGRHRRGAEELGLEVVIGDQFVDAPQTDAPEGGGVEVRVDVEHGRPAEDASNNGVKSGRGS